MSLKSDETSSVSSNLAAMSSEEQKLLAEGFNEGEDPGGENFEQLFAKFAEMKGINLAKEMFKLYVWVFQ